jgi:16S rRNA (guanine1207-N2)-methyltransferase
VLSVRNPDLDNADHHEAMSDIDIIWSNPPIRISKPALQGLLTRWLGRLTPGGHADIVVQRHLGADSLHAWLTESGYPTQRLASAKGYRVLRVRAMPPH